MKAFAVAVLGLLIAGGANAQPALNAGIKIDPHRDVAVIKQWDVIGLHGRKTAGHHALSVCHIPKMRRFVMRRCLRRLIGQQQFHHQLT